MISKLFISYLNNEIIPNFYSKIRFCGNEQSYENKKKKHKIMKKIFINQDI